MQETSMRTRGKSLYLLKATWFSLHKRQVLIPVVGELSRARAVARPRTEERQGPLRRRHRSQKQL